MKTDGSSKTKRKKLDRQFIMGVTNIKIFTVPFWKSVFLLSNIDTSIKMTINLLEIAFWSFKISKFTEEQCPHTPAYSLRNFPFFPSKRVFCFKAISETTPATHPLAGLDVQYISTFISFNYAA